ncbi:MAG: hypothetical protein NT105_13470 [Verrucomicrobia bacterium]|nr:hypothetical protein [Verrucomicrobiota bacterium]
MASLLTFWIIMFASLAVTLAVLNPLYSVFGANLGLKGFWHETTIAVVVSLLQAGVLWAVFQATGWIFDRALFGSAAMLYVGYKATHWTDSVFEGTYAMDDWAIAAVAFTQYGLLVSASFVLPTILSR